MASGEANLAAKAAEDTARPKLVQALHGGILDSKRNSPDLQLECVQTLLKILKNAMENPAEEKYRTIRTTTNAFKAKVTAVKGGEEFLLAAGWLRKVITFEGHYVLPDAAAAEGPVARLAVKLLEDSLAETHAKKERYEKERWLKKNEAAIRKDDIMRSIEEDKRRRAEAAAASAAVAAAAAAAAPALTAGQVAGAGSPRIGAAPGGCDGVA